MDSQEKNIKEKIHDDSKDIHNYLRLNLNHSLNAINPILSQVEKENKNLEPKDNFRKSKQRQLLEIGNKFLNKNNKNKEENIVKGNNDINYIYNNYDKINYSAIKTNKISRIFQRQFSENFNDDSYKLNIFQKSNNDNNNILFNNSNKLNTQFKRRSIDNNEKNNTDNNNDINDNKEMNEKVPMDNTKKRKIRHEKNIIINNDDNLGYKEIKEEKIKEEIKIDIKKDENNDIIKNKNEEEDIILNNDNIVFRDIKDLKKLDKNAKNDEIIQNNDNNNDIKYSENINNDIINENINIEEINNINKDKEKIQEQNKKSINDEINIDEKNFEENNKDKSELNKNEELDLNNGPIVDYKEEVMEEILRIIIWKKI